MSVYKLGDLLSLVQQEAQRQGVDPNIATALLTAENTSDGLWNPAKPVDLMTKGVGEGGSTVGTGRGIFQVTPGTLAGLIKQGFLPQGSELKYDTDVATQVAAGIAAIKEKQSRVGTQDPMALVADWSNGAEGTLGYQGKGPMPPQAIGMMQKVARHLGISVSTKNISPELQGAIDGSYTGYINTADKNLDLLRAMGIESADNAKAGKAAVTAAGEATGQVAKAQGDAAVAAEINRDRLVKLFGLDTTNTDSDAIKDLTRYNELNHQVQMMSPEVDSLMAKSPLTDPLGWFLAQFQLSEKVPQINALIKQRNAATTDLVVRNQLQQQALQREPGVSIDAIRDEQGGKIKLAAAQAQVQSATWDRDQIQLKSKMMNEELQWLGTKFNMNMQQARLFNERLGISAQNAITPDKQHDLDKFNKQFTAIGGIPLNYDEFSKMNSGKREAIMELANSGGGTPGSAIAVILDQGLLPNLQRNSAGMGGFVSKIGDTVRPLYDQKMNNPSDPSFAKMPVNERWKTVINEAYDKWRKEITDAKGDMTKVSEKNPYRMDATVYAANPMLADNAFAKYVKGDGSKMPKIDDQLLASYAISQVRAGRPIDEVQKDWTEFYELGGKYQFTGRGMGTLGFDSKTYKGDRSYVINGDMFEQSSVFGDDNAAAAAKGKRSDVQILNPASAKNFLVREVARSIANESQAQAGIDTFAQRP